jgi:DNA-binding CsgD family transcriptional regulator
MSLYERLTAAATMPIGEPGLDRDDPDLVELLATGFAELDGDPPSSVVAVPLPTALERALSRLQGRFLAQQRQLLEARAYFDALAPRFARAQNAASTGIYLTGSIDVLLVDACKAAHRDITGWNIALQAACPAAGVRVRTICDAAFLRRRGGLRLLREARAAGHELRIAPELPTSMAILDFATVVVDLDGRPDDAEAPSRGVAVGSALVAGAMQELFELIWPRAVPWVDRGDGDQILTPIEHRVAALMAVGRTDDEIAAHLAMSVRSVRRHVAGVMERLHASTRFAAGVAAARAGLLDETDMSWSVPPRGV